ncbi:ATP-dependent DNA helicase RecG [Cetobacterium sp.]|uniref:ATP-dependent DNA helicase RecG n=1 Tax=Cetobacterium sp. TaxID=2071632 RepID=UPI003FA5595C
MYKHIYKNLETFNLKGLGEKTNKGLKKLGINSLYDLLYYFPRAYDDRTNMKKIGELRGEEYVVIKAKIMSLESPQVRSGLKMVKARATDGTGIIELVWFQMPYLKKTLKVGEEYIFIGNVKVGYILQMVGAEYKLLKNQNNLGGEILPIYSSSKEITQNTIRRILKEAINNYLNIFQENIPPEIISEYKIMNRIKALKSIHFPENDKMLEEAKRRFGIEELLVLEMGILEKRFEVSSKNNGKYKLDGKSNLVKEFLKNLEFDLTRAQKRVITEIHKCLNEGKVINHLIQGDVGSGKTVVSTLLLLYMIENGYQTVIMAPTEILATQHLFSIKKAFEKLGVNVELLTGSVKGKKREAMLEKISNGEINLVIGTHALIEENVVFLNLGLVVIDEQHRFGVVQRKLLRDKGILSNLIVMSATPIPRSLALSIYGDLDVAIIDELPPGRQPIKTKWLQSEEEKEKMYDFIDKKIKEGRQAYFVAPLIEESEKLSIKSTSEIYEEILQKLPKFRIGVLHGKMKSSEKDQVMKDFKDGELDILVSTLVIEVGVNIPNSTIMVISDAERFGLSTLHQLRGRVGRGEKQSYCFLLSKTRNEGSGIRLKILEETQDGFKIAEEDLKLRKPGEIFGTRQSGISDLKFIDIVHDVKTIKLVKDICTDYLLKTDGKIENEFLRVDIEEKFKESLTS